MRHVAGFKPSHEVRGGPKRSRDQPALTVDGVRDAIAVGSVLGESLYDPYGDASIEIGTVWCAPGPEPVATAHVLRDLLDLPAVEPTPWLDAGRFPPHGGGRSLSGLDQAERSIVEASERGGLLVVGNEPQMGWLAARLTGTEVPLRRGELACLRRPRQGRSSGVFGRFSYRGRRLPATWSLIWTISPDDSDALGDVREKVKSKMDAAKVLGSFITALVTFVLAQFLDAPEVNSVTYGLRVATATLLFAAAALYFAALFRYDSLLMPPRFWGSVAPRRNSRRPDWLVARPPSSSAWVLYQNMVRVWNRTFLPATVLTGLGVLAFALAIVDPDEVKDWWPLPAALAGGAALGWWIHRSRPVLGAQD